MNGRARVIRKVTKMGRDGRPKIARDRKSLISMERMMARTRKPCTYPECPREFIAAGVEFVRLRSPLWFNRQGLRTRPGGPLVPEQRDYHFECVPPEAWPLLRFFKFPETTDDSTS